MSFFYKILYLRCFLSFVTAGDCVNNDQYLLVTLNFSFVFYQSLLGYSLDY